MSIFTDWRLKIAIQAVIIMMFLTVLFIPFVVSSSVTKEVILRLFPE